MIIDSHKKNISAYQISKNINISRSTIRNIISLFKKTGGAAMLKKPGRPSKITSVDKRNLTKIIKSDRRTSSTEITSKWNSATGKEISRRTCLRTMKKLGYGFFKVI